MSDSSIRSKIWLFLALSGAKRTKGFCNWIDDPALTQPDNRINFTAIGIQNWSLKDGNSQGGLVMRKEPSR
jgi:hypothetical protein